MNFTQNTSLTADKKDFTRKKVSYYLFIFQAHADNLFGELLKTKLLSQSQLFSKDKRRRTNEVLREVEKFYRSP